MTSAEVKNRVDQLARVLMGDLGLISGNRVLLHGGNSIDRVLASMPMLRGKELGEIIEKSPFTMTLCT